MSKRNTSVDAQTIRHFWRMSFRNKKEAFLALLSPVGTICIYTIIPIFIGKILAGLGHPGSNPAQYLPYLVVAGILAIIFNRVGYLNMLTAQANAMTNLQTETLDVLLKRSSGFHNNRVSGKLVSDALDYPEAYVQLSNAVYVNILPFLVILVSGVAVVSFKSPLLGILLAAMSVSTIGAAFYYSKRRAPARSQRMNQKKVVVAHLADVIVNHQTVKTFAREDYEMHNHLKMNKLLLKYRLRDWRMVAIDGNYRILVLLAFQIGFIAVVIRMVQHDPSLLAIGIFAFSYTITLVNRLFEINTMVRSVEEALLQSVPMTEILQEAPEIVDIPNARELVVDDGAIDFNDVVFTYQDNTSNKEVFTQLNLAIKPGEHIGLVGPSGGGKSTLTRLLLRFEDIQEGDISIDGQNIAGVTQASLRSQISYVPQEPLLFHRSIADNIGYGNLDATLDDIKQAARLANAAEFIDELPNGYDTIVGERGVKLSGGQRQRVAIARAILKSAPILILDEATSALDSDNERLIQDALWNLMKDKTAVVIAHRLSTVQRMDRIIVLDNGRILEEGSHKSLLEGSGMYAKLWAHQSGGFLEES